MKGIHETVQNFSGYLLHLTNKIYRPSFSSIKYHNISLIIDNTSWNSLLRENFCLQDHILL